MFEITGSVNTAVCFASIVDEGAEAQIKLICDSEVSRGSRIRIMPDVHLGKGCAIGTTMTVSDKVVPNLVGVDIGCGMFTVKLDKPELDLDALDKAVHKIPSGKEVWDRCIEPFDLTQLKCFPHLKKLTRLNNSLGTLGGGNHFIEVDESKDGDKYLVIHSGSRNLGLQVAVYYQNLAVDLNLGKEEMLKSREELIKTYKEQGRSKEIQSALKAADEEFRVKAAAVCEDICHLYGEYLEDYLHDAEICRRFAQRNREVIAETIMEELDLSAEDSFHTVHNYIDRDAMILRKGAISAKEGEIALIPINMRDGSILARGKGDPEWNFSAPHGAGRLLSRTAAKEKLSLEDYKEAMKGIYSTSVNEHTLDEAPQAYKSLEAIMSDIEDSVDIIEVLKPVYNFKA